MATYTELAAQAVREQQQRTALILEATQTAASTLHLDEVLARIARAIATAVAAPGCSRRPGASFTTDDMVIPALQAGALGYLLKDSEPEALAEAIRQVARGESSLHPAIARKVLHELTRPAPAAPRPAPDPLTEREVEVLRLIAQGLSNQEIAGRLVVAEKTARTHVSNILRKLHLASRTQATLYALREGLASLEDGPPEA